MSAELGAPVRVAVLGCGQIGSRWDAPGTAAHAAWAAGGPSLSHAAAFSRLPGALITGFCDPMPGRAAEAVAAWGSGRAHSTLGTLLAGGPIDLAVVATASQLRLDVVQPLLDAGVRTLVIEKPLATTLAEAQAVHAACQAAGARTLVNYLRHWDPTLAALRQRIADGEFGRVQRLVGLYGKGLANNGSHMIDLVGLLCGAQPVAVRALGSPLPPAEADWSADGDVALDAQVRWRTTNGAELQLDLLATDQRAFTAFELRILGSSAVAELRLGGREVSLRSVQDDPQYAGYRIPGPAVPLVAAGPGPMDGMAAEALALARGQRTQARCNATTALAVAQTVATLKHAAARGCADWISLEQPTP